MTERIPPPDRLEGWDSGSTLAAFPRAGEEPADDTLEIVGALRIRMPEEDVDFPLWDDHGLLPEEPGILASDLGLSPGLISDLLGWGRAWNRLRRQDRGRAALVPGAELLARRIRAELQVAATVIVDLDQKAE